MDYLKHQCGGHHAGMHVFTPHCTLLYNTSFPPCGDSQHADSDTTNTVINENERFQRRRLGEHLLHQCLRVYLSRNQRSDIKLEPTSHYYFPYTKSADDGKGFGCAISLLILETTPELKALHEAVKSVFPPDERHSSGCEEEDADEEKKSGEECEEAQEDAKFRPHMALVYAPENHERVMSGWLEERTHRMEKEKRYLEWTPTSGSESDRIACGDDGRNDADSRFTGY